MSLLLFLVTLLVLLLLVLIITLIWALLNNRGSVVVINSGDGATGSKREEKKAEGHATRVINDPLTPPLKMPVNVRTRGEEGEWQQIGTLRRIDRSELSESSESSESTASSEKAVILPLYGRALYSSSDRYEYYAQSDQFHAIKLPLKYRDRSCSSTVGCAELNDGDRVNIAQYRADFEVAIYDNLLPRYIG